MEKMTQNTEVLAVIRNLTGTFETRDFVKEKLQRIQLLLIEKTEQVESDSLKLNPKLREIYVDVSLNEFYEKTFLPNLLR